MIKFPTFKAFDNGTIEMVKGKEEGWVVAAAGLVTSMYSHPTEQADLIICIPNLEIDTRIMVICSRALNDTYTHEHDMVEGSEEAVKDRGDEVSAMLDITVNEALGVLANMMDEE